MLDVGVCYKCRLEGIHWRDFVHGGIGFHKIPEILRIFPSVQWLCKYPYKRNAMELPLLPAQVHVMSSIESAEVETTK